MGPNVFVHAQGVDAGQPIRGRRAADCFGFDGVPEGMPGHPELIGQSRNRRVVATERVHRPTDGPGGEFRPWTGQRMGFRERRSWTVRLWAAPDAFGPEQAHGLAETRDVMEADMAATVTDRDDPAVRATGEGFTRFHAQYETVTGRSDRGEVDAFDTGQRISTGAPATARTGSKVSHVRASF